MAPRWFPVAALLVVLLVPAFPAAGMAEASAVYYNAKVVEMRTTYGPESWKSNATFYRYGPVNGANNYSSQFSAALGYHVEVKIRLTDESGIDVSPSDETGRVMPAAYVMVGNRRVDAYVERDLSMPEACPVESICRNPVYKLHFDVDGSSYDPDGAGPYAKVPAIPAGLKTVVVDFTRRGALPTTAPENAGSDQIFFALQAASQSITIPGVLPSSMRGVPDNAFRLLNDIGRGGQVAFVHEAVRVGVPASLIYGFGVPGATVELHALTASRSCAPPSCTPDGSFKVHRASLGRVKTDATGAANFSVNTSALLSYPTRSFNAALVILAAQLKPELDRNGSYPAKGGVALAAGSIEAVLPITGHAAQISAFEIDTRLVENASRAPDPVANLAGSVNRITVTSLDPDRVACSDCGDALAYLPDRDALLARASISPDPDPTLPRWKANLPVDSPPGAGIRSARVTTYRVLELFYCPSAPSNLPCSGGPTDGSRQDEFHSLALADRGFLLELGSTPRANVNGQGGFWINITSLNTNYDLNANEKSFELRILARIQSDQAKIDRTETFVVPEGQVLQRYFPISAGNGTGLHIIKVRATTGDVLSDALQTSIDFYDAPPAKRLRGLPGFEPVLLVAAALAALAVVRRKQAF